QMDPRVVQRETGGPGNLPLARDEERERGQGRGDYETVSTPPSEAGGALTAIEHARRRRRGEGAARGRRCSPRSRRASYRATARRDSGRAGSRSRRAPRAARSSGSSGRRTRRAARRGRDERGVPKSRGAGRARRQDDPLTSTARTTTAAVRATRARGWRSDSAALPSAVTSTREGKITSAGRNVKT